jgi:hypothetical protein
MDPSLDYVESDDVISKMERDKLSLQEVNDYLRYHVEPKESMKFYFLLHGKEVSNGLYFFTMTPAV